MKAANRAAAPCLAQHADAIERLAAPREGHHPREPSRRRVAAEVDFDLLRAGEGGLELRALDERARHAQAELRD